MREWTSIKKVLPPNGYALACCSSGNRESTFFWDGKSKDLEDKGYEVTHWMELPEPPKEEKE